MRLTELELKHFGKFHQKTIALQDGVNLISGENEAGKSTVCAFLKAMLFGMERGRGRAAAKDDFTRYEPWEQPGAYAGAIRFVCGEKQFCLQRNFDKYTRRTSLVCETDGEELSEQDGDLAILLDGLTAGSYENTLYIPQLGAAPGVELAQELDTYAAGCYATGDSELNISAAKDTLAAKRKEADRQIRALLQEKQRKREGVEQEAAYVWRELHHMDSEAEEIRRELVRRESERAARKKKAPEEWIRYRPLDDYRPSKWRVHPLEILLLAVVIGVAFGFLPTPWNSIITVILALLSIIYVWNRMKLGKHPERETADEEEGASADAAGEALIPTEKLVWKQEHLRQEQQEKQTEYENLQEKLREMDELGADYGTIDRRRRALELAAERMDQLSAGLRQEVTEKLNGRASEILSDLTDGKYRRLTVDEGLRLSVLTGGRMLAVERLSRGTLEQIYFSLRMAAAEILYPEELPVILDDTFAYYDDARLERTLRWLEASGRQVILFTCQKREEELLKRNGLRYAKIELS